MPTGSQAGYRPIDIPAQAPRSCDLVLKGGIASGIVYPDAVRKLASEFQFVGVAGTSAGAIVASLTAAAEYRRRTSKDTGGFEVLAEATQELMGKGRMLELFRPDAATQAGFRPLRELLQGRLGLGTVWRLLRVPAAWGLALWAAFITAASIPSFASGFEGVLATGGTVLGLALFVALFAIQVARHARRWQRNGYGFCTGRAHGQKLREGELPPLSEWLHRKIQEAAGLPLDRPLTFGDLHGAPLAECLQHKHDLPAFRSIDFRAITTCLTLARPFEFPMTSNRFAFRPEELRRVFPDAIVDRLLAASESRTKRMLARNPGWTSARTCPKTGTLPLPDNEDLPILVATRMSLSFPGLLSMVKLWAVDQPDSKVPSAMQPVWFSDGGITSNLPISRFDAALSSRPTLAINLLYHRDSEDACVGASRGADVEVYLPEIADRGTPELLYPWAERQGVLKAVRGWLMSMFTSAQVWTDNNVVQMRGSRERVVEVWLTQAEGGLNLDMQPEVLERLVDRGYRAAEKLIERFADRPLADPRQPVEPNSWDQYRWVRIRASASALSDLLQNFAETFDREDERDRPWRDYFRLDPSQLANYKPSSPSRSLAMLEDLESLVALAKSWNLHPRVEAQREGQPRFKTSPLPRAEYRAHGPISK